MLIESLDRALGRLAAPGGRLLLAVSGGLDSTVLLHAVTGLAPSHRLSVVVGHIHHGLRGDEADEDERWVARLATDLGVEFCSLRVDPASLREGAASKRARPTVQEAARRVRAAGLRRLAEQSGAERRPPTTAHQRTQAEHSFEEVPAERASSAMHLRAAAAAALAVSVAGQPEQVRLREPVWM